MNPREYVRHFDQLETLPSVAVKAIELASSNSANFEDLVRVIEADPSLASRILKVANSPWLGYPGEVDTLDRALALLGMEMVRTLSLSMLVTGLFMDRRRDGVLDRDALWHHCLACAIAGESLARKMGYSNPKVAFITGLLHDLGKLIFLHWDYERYEKVVEKARSNDMFLHTLERETFGIDHAELGYELLHEWNFPDDLSDAVLKHHRNIGGLAADGPAGLPLIVAGANALCHCQMFGDGYNPKSEYDLQQVHWITGLEAPDIEEISTLVLKRYDTVAELFEDNGGTAELYFSAVSRATKELSDLYQNLVEKAGENQRVHEELKKKDEQLRQAERLEAIGQLAGVVAHGFNNLLTVISGHVELAKSGMESPESLRQDLREIEEAASRAAALTGQLLAFGRQQMLRPKRINLNCFLSDTKPLLQELLEPAGRLMMDLDPGVGEVDFDPEQLRRVVVSLVEYARDSLPEGGQVRVETREVFLDDREKEQLEGPASGHYAVLVVRDTGPGIDDETRQKIFEPFFAVRKTGNVASGFGLASVYGTVMQIGGTIFVNSAKGEGTTFRIYLPVQRQKRVVLVEGENMKPVGNKGILVVEDEESILRLIERALKVQGFQVFGANSPRRADEIFAGNLQDIGLLLTDVVMPGESGLDLYARFKELSPDLKVVFMSGYSEETVQEKRPIDPEAVFIQKPFTPSQLGQRIKNLMGGPDDVPPAAEIC